MIDVQFLRAGDDDIVPATVKRVAGIDEDLAASARKTGDFEPANDASAKQMPRVQAVFADNIVIELLKIIFSQELSGEESRTGISFGLARGARPAAGTAATAR